MTSLEKLADNIFLYPQNFLLRSSNFKMVQNKSLIFKKVPTGLPVAGEHLAIGDGSLDMNAEVPKDGLLVQNMYFSFDPYQRGRMREAHIELYAPAYPINEPINNSAIARVLRSANFEIGEFEVCRRRCRYHLHIWTISRIQRARWRSRQASSLEAGQPIRLGSRYLFRTTGDARVDRLQFVIRDRQG